MQFLHFFVTMEPHRSAKVKKLHLKNNQDIKWQPNELFGIMENELEMMRKQFAILNEIVENIEDLLSTEQE